MEFIAAGAFDDLKYLQSLTIMDNHIKSLAEGAFDSLDSLRVLNLNGNHIKAVPESAFNLPKLQELHLAGNDITELSQSSFVHLISLQVLNLRANRIIDFPKGLLRGLFNIEVIDLSYNPDRFVDIFDEMPVAPKHVFANGLGTVCLVVKLFQRN